MKVLQSARRREVSMWILCRSIYGRNLRFFVLHQISYIGREIWFCYCNRRTGCERLSLDLDLGDHGFLRESRINSQIFLVHFLHKATEAEMQTWENFQEAQTCSHNQFFKANETNPAWNSPWNETIKRKTQYTQHNHFLTYSRSFFIYKPSNLRSTRSPSV